MYRSDMRSKLNAKLNAFGQFGLRLGFILTLAFWLYRTNLRPIKYLGAKIIACEDKKEKKRQLILNIADKTKRLLCMPINEFWHVYAV